MTVLQRRIDQSCDDGSKSSITSFNKNVGIGSSDDDLDGDDRRYSPTKLCDGTQMAIFLGPAFPARCVQHISDLHSKFALRPHHVWKYGRHPISNH